MELIQQLQFSDALMVRTRAKDLPFEHNSFDPSVAILIIQHWSYQAAGVAAMMRITRGIIIFLTYDPGFREFWLFVYFPALVTLDETQMPRLEDFESWLGKVMVSALPIPHDAYHKSKFYTGSSRHRRQNVVIVSQIRSSDQWGIVRNRQM